MIPMDDPKREYSRLRPQIDAAIDRVVRHGSFLEGEEGDAFEAEWATYCGTSHAIAVGNGTDALHLALWAANIGPGDEVIVPALMTRSTSLAVSLAGAAPIVVDVDPLRYTLDPLAFEAALTPRTAAVIAVHLYGCPADMDPIVAIARRHGLLVVEDASQAAGARYRDRRTGALADAAAFGFAPGSNLGAYGDAGVVTTDDAGFAGRVRSLRHGSRLSTGRHEFPGLDSRTHEIQAAILRAKLPHMDGWNRRRRNLAARYDNGLPAGEELLLPSPPEEVEHVYHRYVLRTSARDALRDYLGGAGVATAVHEPPAYAALGAAPGCCPNAEAALNEILALPLFPQLSTREVEQVCSLVRFFYAIR